MSRDTPAWMPDWTALMQTAPEIALPAAEGDLYVIADAHLGDVRAPAQTFVDLLDTLPQPAGVVFMGDLFKVWLAIPKYWDVQVRSVLAAFRRLRERGVPVVFVVGNREYFLPTSPQRLARSSLPFDHVIHGAGILHWAGRRYGLSHGDLVNRRDSQYLRWRRLSRSPWFEGLFRALPGGVARRIAERLERALADTNQQIKIQYPQDELEAFAATVLGNAALGDLDGFLLGHFHRDETITVPGHRGSLRIVPDWFSHKTLLRMHPDGTSNLVELEAG
jgi:UDP-2,3-diacylglucosamine hydrolase